MREKTRKENFSESRKSKSKSQDKEKTKCKWEEVNKSSQQKSDLSPDLSSQHDTSRES